MVISNAPKKGHAGFLATFGKLFGKDDQDAAAKSTPAVPREQRTGLSRAPSRRRALKEFQDELPSAKRSRPSEDGTFAPAVDDAAKARAQTALQEVLKRRGWRSRGRDQGRDREDKSVIQTDFVDTGLAKRIDPDDPAAKAASIARKLALKTCSKNAVLEPLRDSKTSPSSSLQAPAVRGYYEAPDDVAAAETKPAEVPKEVAREEPTPPPASRRSCSVKRENIVGKILGDLHDTAEKSAQARKLQPRAAPAGLTKPLDGAFASGADDGDDKPPDWAQPMQAQPIRALATALDRVPVESRKSEVERAPKESRNSAKERAPSRGRRVRSRSSSSSSSSSPRPAKRSVTPGRKRRSLFALDAGTSMDLAPCEPKAAIQHFGPDDIPVPTDIIGRLLGNKMNNIIQIEAHLGGKNLINIQVLPAPKNVKGGTQKLQCSGHRKQEAKELLCKLLAEIRQNQDFPISETATWREFFSE